MQTIDGVNVTDAQADVYNVIKDFAPPGGIPDHALVPLAQHAVGVRQSSSGIRTRRHELVELDLLKRGKRRWRTSSGRRAAGWSVR